MLSLSPLAWCVLAIAGLMPPVMLMMLSRARPALAISTTRTRDRSNAMCQP